MLLYCSIKLMMDILHFWLLLLLVAWCTQSSGQTANRHPKGMAEKGRQTSMPCGPYCFWVSQERSITSILSVGGFYNKYLDLLSCNGDFFLVCIIQWQPHWAAWKAEETGKDGVFNSWVLSAWGLGNLFWCRCYCFILSVSRNWTGEIAPTAEDN